MGTIKLPREDQKRPVRTSGGQNKKITNTWDQPELNGQGSVEKVIRRQKSQWENGFTMLAQLQ